MAEAEATAASGRTPAVGARTPPAGVRAADTLMPRDAPYRDVPSDDPTVVHTLAVTTDDVVTALEANERRDAGAVLRVTPPFSGRMRARLHVEGETDYDPPAPLHVPPERLVGSVPPLPTPDDTEDEIRSDPDATYSRELHRERHERAVERWRAAVREAVVETATLETPGGPHEVDVSTLG